MPELISPAVARYLDGLLPARDPLLADLEQQAGKERIPICGPQVGQFLALLVAVLGARRALEIGTAIGYAAIWMGRALGESGGRLESIELNAARAERARANLAHAGLDGVVQVTQGAALTVLPDLRGPYELIFMDAVKAEYPGYFQHALPLVAPGGVLIADNALLGGEVVPHTPTGYWTETDREGIRRYNALAFGHPDLETVLLPLRDGLTVSRRRRLPKGQ